ncbi:DUF6302 family protein [Streptomyces sp. CB00072]|uniref:DUF6302 family protein n=1 Tax=Streptomyces sp. CB00072 TaxID=1703928 RepID=UPI000D1B6AB1|nr:DUF6302 family protein [Streptomyces sp. CB00072]
MRADLCPLAALLPPGAPDEEETAYYRQRLDDPSLLDRAVAVQVEGSVVLAVPVGGWRKGGYLSVSEVVTGLAARSLLRGRPGFPDVRLSWSPYPDCCHVVRWGAPVPYEDDPIAEGRFYGYSKAALASFAEAYGHLI